MILAAPCAALFSPRRRSSADVALRRRAGPARHLHGRAARAAAPRAGRRAAAAARAVVRLLFPLLPLLLLLLRRHLLVRGVGVTGVAAVPPAILMRLQSPIYDASAPGRNEVRWALGARVRHLAVVDALRLGRAARRAARRHGWRAPPRVCCVSVRRCGGCHEICCQARGGGRVTLARRWSGVEGVEGTDHGTHEGRPALLCRRACTDQHTVVACAG